MPDDGSNVGQIEPQDAYDALVEALEEGARETSATATTMGMASRPPRPSGRWIACFANGEPKLTPPTTGRHARRQVAVLGHFARAFGRETSKTVLANVARA